jgi:protein-disulfide isomerase
MDMENKNDLILPASIILGAIIISASVLYAGGVSFKKSPSAVTNGTGSASDTNAGLALGKRDIILGDSKAPVTVIEYADYQCPFCEGFYKSVESKIQSDYINSGKVKFVYRNFPFLDVDQSGQPTGYKESHLSAEAAECAKDQNKFWPFHDQLFIAEGKDGQERNGNLNRTLFLQIASQVGMNSTTFAQCFDSHKYASVILADSGSASALGVQGTPTVFINGAKLSGVDPKDPYGQYKTAIDNALKSQ